MAVTYHGPATGSIRVGPPLQELTYTIIVDTIGDAGYFAFYADVAFPGSPVVYPSVVVQVDSLMSDEEGIGPTGFPGGVLINPAVPSDGGPGFPPSHCWPVPTPLSAESFDEVGFYLGPGAHSVTIRPMDGDGTIDLSAIVLARGYTCADGPGAVPTYGGAVLPSQWAQIKHVDGTGKIRTSGALTELWAAGALRLQTPFKTMTPPTEFVLGKDPLTSLPMWVDPPAAGSSIPIPPVSVPPDTPPVVPPTPGDACVQTRCGAALALQTKLVHDYQNWQHWINAAIGFAVGGLIASVLAELAAILAVAEVAAWVLQVLKSATPLIATSSVSVLPSLIPNLSVPQEDALLHAFFCQVQCAGGEVAFNVTDQQAVSAAILADTTTYTSDLMRELLGEIVYYDPIQDWQAAMTNAPVSGLCDGMTCP